MYKASRAGYRETISQRCRAWRLLGQPRLAHPRPPRLPWATPVRHPTPYTPPGAIDLPLPPWPGFPRSAWLEDELLPALEASSRRLDLQEIC